MNYLGDWGTQVIRPIELCSSPPYAPFQFGLIATGFEKYGNEERLREDAIKHLFEVYVKVNADAERDPKVKEEAAAWFKRMEDGDESALANWRVWRELSIKKYEGEYARLNVHFDVYTGESEVKPEYQALAFRKLEEKGLIADVDGAKLVDLEKYKLGKAVVRKRGWSPSLFLRFPFGSRVPNPRRHFNLPHSRHCRCYTAIREIQIRQDDLCHRLRAGPSHRTVLQSPGALGVPLG